MKKLLCLVCLLCTLLACSDNAPSGGKENEGKQPQIELNVTSSDFTTNGGTNTISFTASAEWTAQLSNDRAASWCSVSPASGPAGNASITITTTPNDTPDERTASVVIKSGKTSKTIKVSQKQKDALTITSSSFEVSFMGGKVTIEVKANVNFEYTIDESAKSWIAKSTTRALKTSKIVLDVAENEGKERREGKVYIKSGAFNETVTIYQEGLEPSIVISQNEYVVPAYGGTVAVDVASNVNVSVELPEDVDWISECATRAVSTHTYYFDVAPSDEYDQRTAEIRFVNKENNLSEVVTITQTQNDVIVIAEDSYTVDKSGGQIQIEVGHNVDLKVAIDADWISQVATRSFETSTLVFNVAANPNDDHRSTVITFYAEEWSVAQSVVVNQMGSSFIISTKEYNITGGNWYVGFVIAEGVEYTVSEPDVDWVHQDTEKVVTNELWYNVDANPTFSTRVAKIVVTNLADNATDTLKIIQSSGGIVPEKEQYEIGSEGGTLDITVDYDMEFDVEIQCDWITLPAATRSVKTKTFTFNVDPNPNEYSRGDYIVFKSKDNTIWKYVWVTQSEKEGFIIPSKEYTVGSWSGRLWVETVSNVEVVLSEPTADWIRRVSTRGMDWNSFCYEYDENPSYESRVAQIVVTDVNQSRFDTIIVTQEPKKDLIPAESDYKVDSKGGKLQIDVEHNTDFNVSIGVDWITQSVTRSLDKSTLVFDVAANPEYYERSGSIMLYSKDWSVVRHITVTQSEKEGFVIYTKEYTVGQWGGGLWLEIVSNVEVVLSEPTADWIRRVSTRGMNWNSFYYECKENTTYESRVAQIVVTDVNQSRYDTITVIQEQKNAIIPAEKNYRIDSKGGQLQIEVGHNVEFDVTINVNWISQVTTRSFDASTLVFNVAANPEFRDRVGTIKFTSKDGSITQTVKVTQDKDSSFDTSVDDWDDDEGDNGGSAE